jgi:four helix bundle protein
MNRKYDLEERLINFASDAIDVSEGLPDSFAGKHIAQQLVRSSTSPALNYGEAQKAGMTSYIKWLFEELENV